MPLNVRTDHGYRAGPIAVFRLSGQANEEFDAMFDALSRRISRSILPGQQGIAEISAPLESTTFGTICLTRTNVTAPWINFEAGALAKEATKALVMPLLIDLQYPEVTGPLAIFQCKSFNRESILEIISTINGATLTPIKAVTLEEAFNLGWPRLEVKFGSLQMEI